MICGVVGMSLDGLQQKKRDFFDFFSVFFSVFSVFLQKILLHCYTKKRTVYLYLYLPNIYSRVPRIPGVFFFFFGGTPGSRVRQVGRIFPRSQHIPKFLMLRDEPRHPRKPGGR